MKTTWNLKLLYKSDIDPQIEKDMRAIEKACADFERKYRNKNFTNSTISLLGALKEYEQFLKKSTYKPVWYFHLAKSINTDSQNIAAKEAQYDERQRIAFNKTLFFQLALGKISKEKQKIFLADNKLKHFRYFLQKIFETAKYNLPENEEQLFSLLSQPAATMWYEAQQKLLAIQTVAYQGRQISLSEATEIFGNLPTKKQRSSLYQRVLTARKSTAHMAEAEINAIYLTKKISDDRRGYKLPYEATIHSYENDRKEVEDLVSVVTEYFYVSKKFFSLHKKLIKDSTPTIADLYVHIGRLHKKFDFDKAITVVKKAFTHFDEKYARLLDAYLHNGQIDVFPQTGKKGGGFCSGLGTLPVFVFLNHVDNIKSIETLAHEMGHAIHTELSKPLDPLYGEYSIAVAEVASTFFEQFVADELLTELSDDEKIIILHDRINRDIATIFRQIACFNCELELHQELRKKGKLSKEEMARIMQKHLKSYIGEGIVITEDDGYIFTSWSHLRYSFYVYTYAYGLLVSKALYENWKQDPSYAKKVEQFLSAGGSMSPKDIFKSIGINTNKAFFEKGLKAIDRDIDTLEKLAKKQKRI